MVQIDPGGAVASTFRGADPEAVILATSSKDTGSSVAVPTSKKSFLPVPSVVVEAFESRHIVDELRDDGEARSTANEPSQNCVIDLTASSQPKTKNDPGYRMWPTDTTRIGESPELLTPGETVSIVMPEDRNYSGEVSERALDEREGQRDNSLLLESSSTPPVPLSTKTSVALQPQSTTQPVEQPTESAIESVPNCGFSFLSTIFACIDPTYSNNAPAPTVVSTEKEPPTTQVNSEILVVEKFNAIVDQGPVDVPFSTNMQSATSYTSKPTSPPKPENAMNIQLTTNNLHDDKSHILVARTEDDDGSEGVNLLNLEEDMASVPSVEEDVADSVAPMEPDDLPCSNIDSASPSQPSGADIVEENYKVVETNLEEASLKSEQREKAAKMSPEVKRVGKEKKDQTRKSAATAKPSTPAVSIQMDDHLETRRRILTKELKSVVGTHGRYDLRCANVSAALGDIMDEAHDHGHAVKLHSDAVSIYSCKLGDDHSTTLKAKMKLGMVLENAGDIEQAINLYYQVTVMRKALRGDKDASVGDGLVCMARALRKKEDYVQAIKELKRALKIFRQSLGDSDEKVSSTVDDIASLYITIGDFAKSAAILEEVVKLKAATLGARSNQVGSTLLQLASAYECAGEQANAIRSLKKAYKIFSEIGGYSGEDATTTLNRMAMLYDATKDHNRAAVAYLGVLRSRKIHNGPRNTAVGETYFHLGRSLRLTGQYDKSLKCLKEALPIFVGQGAELEDVKMVADIMHEMAMVNQDRGNYKDSARIFKQELSVRRKIGQPNVPFISRTLLFIGIADFSMKNYNQALKHLVEALALFQERGEEGLDCAKVLYYTGLVFEKVDNRSRAIEALAEAIRLFEDNDVDSDSKNVAHAKEKIEFLRSQQHP